MISISLGIEDISSFLDEAELLDVFFKGQDVFPRVQFSTSPIVASPLVARCCCNGG